MVRRLTSDEERLIHAVRAQLASRKKTQINDEVIEQVTRLVKSLTGPRKSITDAVGPVCSTADLVDWMGISRQAVNKAVKECRIFGVREGNGSWMYPTWQLTSNFQIVNGLPEVLGRLDGAISTVEIGRWFISAHPELEGLSPAKWLQHGREVRSAVRVAELLARKHR